MVILQQAAKYTDPEHARDAVSENVARRMCEDAYYGGEIADQSLRGAVVSRMNDLFPYDKKDIVTLKRYALLSWFFGRNSSKSMTDAECRAFLWWSSENVDGEWEVPEAAIEVANAILERVGLTHGQQKLF